MAMVAPAREITEANRHAHGGSVHVGDPAELGIEGLSRPDLGDAVTIHCCRGPDVLGLRRDPRKAIAAPAPEIANTQEPGHMFITDLLDSPHTMPHMPPASLMATFSTTPCGNACVEHCYCVPKQHYRL